VTVKRAILSLGLILIYTTGIAQNNCDLKKDEAGIKVYLCETEASSFKTIKVNFKANGTIQEYANGVLDVAGYKNWQVSILHVEILEQISETELIYYAEIDTPWPLAHRDVIFHLIVTQDDKSKILQVSLEQLPTYIPSIEHIVRVPLAKSLLTVTPIDTNRLTIEYYLEVNPGGDVPAFIANIFAANTPWNTFNNFRNKLESNDFEINSNLSSKDSSDKLRTVHSY
jgi:START domain-containing protein